MTHWRSVGLQLLLIWSMRPAGTYTNITAAQIPINWNRDVILLSPTQALIADIPIAPSAQFSPFQRRLRVTHLQFQRQPCPSLSVQPHWAAERSRPFRHPCQSRCPFDSHSRNHICAAVPPYRLALNNAGTLELAVVNIAGGNDLTETGLINTTTIAGGSNTANVIYSTTGRTGVAYRVIGYIESTQATAGTWVTAPSTIQGRRR